MSVEEIKARWRRFVETWGKGKATYMAALDELFATDFVAHTARGEDIHGLENFKQGMSEVYDAFPDFHGTLEDIVVEGDKVVMRHTWGSTNKGEYMGRPPTNKKVTVRALSIDRVVDGKIVESWIMTDRLGMMQQLGAVPTPKTE
jgi:steroid delta-isomerase-like uncharacterized protein